MQQPHNLILRRALKMKIQPGECKQCRAVIFLVREAGITWTADMTPLDAQTVIPALVRGAELYLVTLDGKKLDPMPATLLKSYLSSERTVLASHGCPTALARPLLSLVEKQAREGDLNRPKDRETGTQGPSRPSLDPTPSSDTATTAGNRPFKIDWNHVGVKCSTCHEFLDMSDPASYAMFELGATVVDAFHVGPC